MGKATSSMITVVPVSRTAPTAGKSPLRMFHSEVYSATRSVKAKGRSKGTRFRESVTVWTCPWSSSAV